MTTQQAYEMMRTYLGRPGARRAGNADGTQCYYETQIEGETHRCAVGLLFSPEGLDETVTLSRAQAQTIGCAPGTHSVRNFTGSITSLIQAGYKLADLDGVDRSFLREAQFIHDCDMYWRQGTVVAQLDSIAAKRGLTVMVDEPVQAKAPERELVLA